MIMYSSSSSSFDPFHYSSTISPSFTDPNNPAGLPFLLQFSAPFLEDDNGDLLLSDSLIQPPQNLQHNPHNSGMEEANPNPEEEMNSNKGSYKKKKSKSSSESKQQQASPPKRSGKKDRHSKIYTAHGPRDRRMRLSLQIARKFFDLQDMLGFDKASKTIDWLFSKSKSAIKEVTDNFPNKLKTSTDSCGGGGKSVYSTSSESSEVMSGSIKLLPAEKESESWSFSRQKRSKKLSSDDHKQVLSPLGKESRDMARARARERTKHKLKIKSKAEPNPNPSNLDHSDAKSFHLENQEMKMAIQQEDQDQEEEEDDNEKKASCMVQQEMGTSYLGVTKSTWIFDLCHENIAAVSSRGADFEDEFSGFPGRSVHHSNNRYNNNSDMIKTGDVVHLHNPNFIYQDQNLISLLDQQHNNFINLLSHSNQQNPTPLFPMSTNITTPNFHSHFSSNPNGDTLF